MERFSAELYDHKETINFYIRELETYERELELMDQHFNSQPKIETIRFHSSFRMLEQRLVKLKNQVRRQERIVESIILGKSFESLLDYMQASQNTIRTTMNAIGIEFLSLKYGFSKFYMSLFTHSLS